MQSPSATRVTLCITSIAIATNILLGSGAALAQQAPPTQAAQRMQPTEQEISPSSARPTVDAPAQFFTGKVRITPLFAPTKEAPVTGGYVTFARGARSAWHTHPTGQRLVIIAGTARTQVWGGPVLELKAGDVLWCPPGVKHWHGAAPNEAMTHLALTGTVDGNNVRWMEKVGDAQYGISQSHQPKAEEHTDVEHNNR